MKQKTANNNRPSNPELSGCLSGKKAFCIKMLLFLYRIVLQEVYFLRIECPTGHATISLISYAV
jgi:hypothetical protein